MENKKEVIKDGKLSHVEVSTIYCAMCITCRWLDWSDGTCNEINKLDFGKDNKICKFYKA